MRLARVLEQSTTRPSMPTPTNDPEPQPTWRAGPAPTGLSHAAGPRSSAVDEPWLTQVVDIEDNERWRSLLKRVSMSARLSAFEPFADFDATWPSGTAHWSTNCSFAFVEEGPPTWCSSARPGSANHVARTSPPGGPARLQRRFTRLRHVHDLAPSPAPPSPIACAVTPARRSSPSTNSAISPTTRYAICCSRLSPSFQQRPTRHQEIRDWTQVFPNAGCVSLWSTVVAAQIVTPLEGRATVSRKRRNVPPQAKARTARASPNAMLSQRLAAVSLPLDLPTMLPPS